MPSIHAPSPLLRYWGAVTARRAKELPADFAKLLADSDPVVRVAAAETLLRRETHAAAWRVLADELNAADAPMLPLFTLNALAHLSRPYPDPIPARVRKLARPGEEVKADDLVVRASRPLLER